MGMTIREKVLSCRVCGIRKYQQPLLDKVPDNSNLIMCVDYAAPKGTPVVSIGDGTVIFKAYKGGGGNTVKIKHNSTYTTAYLHLNGYAKDIQVGKHVKQGQVIGYVGTTGHATGPHLDFRVWKNGTPIDPLKLQSPPATPVPDPLKQDFLKTISEYRKHL